MAHFKLKKGKLEEVKTKTFQITPETEVGEFIQEVVKTVFSTIEQLAQQIYDVYENFTDDDFKKDGGLRVDAVERELKMEVSAKDLERAQPYLDKLLKKKG